MAKQKPQPMKAEFAQWYRTVDMGDDPARVERRWIGVSNLIKQNDEAVTEALVALSFKTKSQPKAELIDKVRLAFQTADDQFNMQRNDRELEVLSGISLDALFDQATARAAYAALAVTTASCGGARRSNLPFDLVGRAEQAIADIAESSRHRPDLQAAASAASPNVSFEPASTHVKQAWNQEGVAQAFKLAADATNTALGQVATQLKLLTSSVNDFIAIQDEELQMLWWLFGGRSSEMNCAFDDVPANAQPFLLASELAKMTEFLPGPASVKALLSRAGVKESKKLSVTAAVNGCDTKWLERLLEAGEPSAVTQPLHFAIRRKLETGDETSWIAGWAAAAGFSPNYSLPPLALSSYFYRECLLRKFADGA